jgi:Amt family ammonium transporter
MAMLVTHLSAATASLTWLVIEWVRYGRPSLVGLVTGTIAGLATVTPASGYIGPIGGVALGLAGGIVCYLAVGLIKKALKIDDSLDVLAVHGFGGATGTVLTAIFAVSILSGTGLGEGVSVGRQLGVQIIGVVAGVVWSAVATVVLIKVTQALVGLRVTEDEELAGLDQTAHGESGYNL